MALVEIKGTLVGVKYRNEDSGWTVAELRTQKRSALPIVGKLPAVPLGSYLKLSGFHGKHEQYGDQFQFKSFEVEMPSSAAGVVGYLEYMPNIGPSIARRIVQHFGEKEVLEVMEKHPERLVEVAGISPERVKKIHAAFLEHGSKREVLIFLKKLQLTDYQINCILAHYKVHEVYRVFETNPYQLIERVSGFGFKIVDKIALKAGIDKNGIPRAKAACRHLLKEASDNEGHCYLPWGVLKYRLMKELEIDPKAGHMAVKFMVEDGNLFIEDETKIFTSRFLAREKRCAKLLLRMVEDNDG